MELGCSPEHGMNQSKNKCFRAAWTIGGDIDANSEWFCAGEIWSERSMLGPGLRRVYVADCVSERS